MKMKNFARLAAAAALFGSSTLLDWDAAPRSRAFRGTFPKRTRKGAGNRTKDTSAARNRLRMARKSRLINRAKARGKA